MSNQQNGKLRRRDFLRAGSLAGLTLADLLWLQESAPADSSAPTSKGGGEDVNCIFLFLVGGAPHQDLFDLKPDAPAEIRGDFKPIQSKVPGILVSDVVPGIARVTDKLAIVRSMTHGDSDHQRGYHIMMTGAAPRQADFQPDVKDNNHHPCFGAMVAKMARAGSSLPPYISVPNFLPSGGPAFLGASCAPFVIESDPASPEFAVRDITLPGGVTPERSTRRQRALREMNRLTDAPHAGRQVRSLDTFYEKAYGLMTSRRAQEAFDIHREPQKLREEYGLTSIGQCCLLARRLVEAGCRFVTIEHGHWDTHRKNTWSLKELLVPDFDRAVPALLNDLASRGLLDKTLVVVSTEFGRTPRINQLAGRDHWPGAFSVCLAGGGIKAGQVIGRTDHQAARVTDRPITPQDLGATLLSRLGINPHAMLHTSLGRPIELVSGGKPIAELG